jgi:hypothetical protein
MKADFDSGLTNVTSVDVDATIQAVYGAVLASSPVTTLATTTAPTSRRFAAGSCAVCLITGELNLI